MKSAMMVPAVLLIVGLSAATAQDSNRIDDRILSAFKNEFSFAQNVKWSRENENTRVSFTLNDQRLLAWYNPEGEQLSVARNILYMQLPLAVVKAFEQNYGDASTAAITEVTRSNETVYYIQSERKGKKYLLRASPSGHISVIKKIKG